MLTFAENATASGLADSWFYIRYTDPDAHIRLRFRGSPDRLSGQLFGHVCDWARRLMSDGLCLKFVFDTYERELERYGGLAGMAAAETVFSADSRYAAAPITRRIVGLICSSAREPDGWDCARIGTADPEPAVADARGAAEVTGRAANGSREVTQQWHRAWKSRASMALPTGLMSHDYVGISASQTLSPWVRRIN